VGKKYVLTGSEAMSYRQAAEIIAAVIGKPVRFVDESPDQARARRVREGVPPAVIESVLAIGAYQRAGGKTVTITSTIADLTGRPPRTVAEFVREHSFVFPRLIAANPGPCRATASVDPQRSLVGTSSGTSLAATGPQRCALALTQLVRRAV
jgi:hypothetical protein